MTFEFTNTGLNQLSRELTMEGCRTGATRPELID